MHADQRLLLRERLGRLMGMTSAENVSYRTSARADDIPECVRWLKNEPDWPMLPLDLAAARHEKRHRWKSERHRTAADCQLSFGAREPRISWRCTLWAACRSARSERYDVIRAESRDLPPPAITTSG